MNKLFFIVLFIFLSFLIRGQTGITFNDTIKPFGSGAYGIENVLEDANNYYALGVYNSSLGQFPFIIKINQFGQILNKELFIDTSFSYAPYPYNSFVKTNNNLLFCSPKWNNTIGTLGTVICVDKNTLDTVWTKTYTHPDTVIAQTATDVFSVLTSIKATPDGGYILTGNYNKDCITGNLRSFLMKIDSVGNVLWRRVYGDLSYVFSIELVPNNGYSFINKYGGTSFILTDSVGNIILNKSANNLIGRATSGSLKYLGNNQFIVSTPFMYNIDITNPLFGVNVFKISISTQQILWDKTYILFKDFDCISLHQAMGVEALANGDIIISGTANNFGHDAVILKLNSNGDSLWCKSYDFEPDPYDCQLNDLIVTTDGGFMGVGFWSDQSGPGWTAWMFKTDANGVVGWEEHPKTESTYKAMIYPNPAINFVTLKYDCRYANMNYNITDMSGKTLLSGELKTIANAESNEELLDLGSLSPGSYTLEVRAKGLALWSQKLVINK